MARTTLLAIEQGQRPVRPDELLALAKLYDTSVGRLTSSDAVHVDLSAKFRRVAGKNLSEVEAQAVTLLQRLATGAAQLERAVGRAMRSDYPPPVRLRATDVHQQAEDAADRLRARLGLGLGPIGDLVGLLESELGLRIFFRPLASQVSGLYAYAPEIGACIVVNANHHWKRRLQTVAHETGHLVADGSHADILEDDERSLSTEDRFAKRFGHAFLMPASAVRGRFAQIAGSESRFDVRELILLAHQYGVTTESMCRRLGELDLLPRDTWGSIGDRGLTSDLERGVVGYAAVPHPPLVPPLLAYQASIALERELLSEGQLCDLLAIDRLQLREAVAPFEADERLSLRA